MSFTRIKEALNADEYSFLRTNPNLNENIILLTLGGSHAYGTNTESSDIDIRGIALNSKREILTMNCKDKPIVNTATDTTIYFLKQITKLLSDCNPNCVEILGTDDEQLLKITKSGQLLRDNANLFLSKKAIHSFGGYATSQLRRLQNALARDSYPQSEKEQHILNSLQGQTYHLKTNYTSFSDKEISLCIDKSNKVDFDTEIFIDINLKHYPLRDLKAMYSDMSNVIKDYESISHRNNKKDDLHLNKHAMHLIRLLIMGTEILEGKGIKTNRIQDRDFLMKIRNGDFVKANNDYSEVFEIVDEYDKKFQYAKCNTCLPDAPDYNGIEELIMEINREVVS